MMSLNKNGNSDTDFMPPPSQFDTFMLAFAGFIAGGFAALALLPAWVPELVGSVLGPDAKIYWYLSRGSAIVSYGLLWLSMILGLLITNKMASAFPGKALTANLHQYVSLLGIVFAASHGMLLIGDQYINFNLAQVFLPFATRSYKPFWVGIGQIGLYAWAVVAFSYYLRKTIGRRSWRLIHYASFIAFIFALIHGIASGSDSTMPLMQNIYWLSGASLLFMLTYRILSAVLGEAIASKSTA